MKRSRFLRSTATGIIGGYTLSSLAAKYPSKLTVLHTNDTHSRIDPFPENHSKYGNQGGVNARFDLIQKVRAEEQNVLLLDAGDIFQGTPYFNLYGGELEMKLMSRMGYDAATMGNHDFDAGLDGFAKAYKYANFNMICSNYDFSDTLLSAIGIQKYKIFEKSGLKIGVLGIGIQLQGLVPDDLFGDTQVLNAITEAQRTADLLKKDFGCHLVICLSHLGHFPRLDNLCDPVLAKETSNIDLIIGGHTHTFMEAPEIHKNRKGKPVLINQVGWAGLMLGRIDFYFDHNGKPDLWASCLLSNSYNIT